MSVFKMLHAATQRFKVPALTVTVISAVTA
jgi:hypothetical protein